MQRVREIRRRMFTLSIKREIRQFKSQSCSDGKEMYKKGCCCFANLNQLLFDVLVAVAVGAS